MEFEYQRAMSFFLNTLFSDEFRLLHNRWWHKLRPWPCFCVSVYKKPFCWFLVGAVCLFLLVDKEENSQTFALTRNGPCNCFNGGCVCDRSAERLVMKKAPILQRPGSIIMNYPTAVCAWMAPGCEAFFLFSAHIPAVKPNCQWIECFPVRKLVLFVTKI